MAATWMEEGLDLLLKWIFRVAGDPHYEMHLFTNDVTPDCTDTTADYDDCTLSGYAPIDFTSAVTGFSTASCIARCNAGILTFTFDPYAGGTTIYGYYCKDRDGTKLFFADVLRDGAGDPAPYLVPDTGGSVIILPFFSLRKL